MAFRGALSTLFGLLALGFLTGCLRLPIAKPLATGQGANVIAADGRDVFFIAEHKLHDGREVRAVPNRGGKVRTVYSAPKGRRVAAMVVDGGEVFIGEYTENHKQSSILAVPAGGGKPRVITEYDGMIRELAVDASHVYFFRGRRVVKVPRAGGDQETVFDVPPNANPGSYALAIAGNDLVLGTPRQVFLLPSKKGPARPLVGVDATCFAGYGGRIYWAYGTYEYTGGGWAHSVDRSGKNPMTHRGLCPLVERGGIVFAPDNTLVRAHPVGTDHVPFAGDYVLRANDGDPIRWVAVDGKGVYASTKSGKIMYTPIKWK